MVSHYFWDIKQGSPNVFDIFPSTAIRIKKENFNPIMNENENIDVDYIAQTQLPNFQNNPEYKNENTRDSFIKNKLRILRDYQLEALKVVQLSISEGKDRFLLKATGTGKHLSHLQL